MDEIALFYNFFLIKRTVGKYDTMLRTAILSLWTKGAYSLKSKQTCPRPVDRWNFVVFVYLRGVSSHSKPPNLFFIRS